jgi:hypothetical protein
VRRSGSGTTNAAANADHVATDSDNATNDGGVGVGVGGGGGEDGDELMYVTGGFTRGRARDDVWAFDFRLGVWVGWCACSNCDVHLRVSFVLLLS